jgi:ABC-type phosphate/phosphonate transport system substrate-binding protein
MQLSRIFILALCLLWTPTGMTEEGPLIFSAPPRASVEVESKVFIPVARYLSQAINRQVIYKHPGDWLSYQSNMQQGLYDIVYDGPHLVAWRIERLQHEPLATLPSKLAFNIFVHKDNARDKKLKNLCGRSICGMAPPNLATLTLLDLFADNPVRQPLMKEVKSFKIAYQSVLSGKCIAAVMRDKAHAKIDKDKQTRVVHHTAGTVNQSFSAGPRLTADEKQILIKVLTSPDSINAIPAFHQRFNRGKKPLLTANPDQYKDLLRMLANSWGFI